MTWNQFLIWVLIGYLIYYAFNIIYDLFVSKSNHGSDDEDIYQLTHEEVIPTVDVQDLFNEKNNNNTETTKPPVELKRKEEIEEQKFVQTDSTGGMSVKKLFSIYSGKASVDTDSILWD